MKFFLSEKYLVVVFALLLAGSSVFLFWQNDRELDPDQSKNWWTLSFAAPENRQNLDFTLENHSTKTDFQYRIMLDKKILAEAAIVLAPGETKTITPNITASDNARTSIIVTSGTEKKEIYR